MRSNLDLITPAGGPTTRSGGCGCGCSSSETPELRVTDLPKIIRHGAVVGGLTSMKPGQQIVLVAPHDPKPLLTQLHRTAPDSFDVVYLEEGPVDWRLQVTRRG